MTSMGSTLSFDVQERLCMAARDGPVETIRALVKEGADVLRYDAAGRTAGRSRCQLWKCSAEQRAEQRADHTASYGNAEVVRVILGAMCMHDILNQKCTRN
jgi:hypothetical protein